MKLKGLSLGCLVHFAKMPHMCPYSLLRNQSFVSNKYGSQALYQTLQTTKWTSKTCKANSFQKPQLQSVLIFKFNPSMPPFVSADCIKLGLIFQGCQKVFKYQAPVVKKVDSAIQWIISIQWITQLVSLILICWIAIYPVDSAIQVLNNRGQADNE